MSESAEALARTVADDPFFLAAVLAAYAHSAGLDDAGLAGALGCPPAVLVWLRLCRAPEPRPPQFGKDVDAIAERFGVDADRLAEVVRRGQSLLQMQARPGAAGGLLAARDREPPAEGPS